MTHLSDEQLNGVLDDALPAREREACDAHLAACEPCRARLAELSALDASLGSALTHDPGDAYFADFASRVSQRIAAEAAPAAPAAKRGFWDWLRSPRGLTLAGSMAALLVVVGVAWQRFGGSSQNASALLPPAPSAVGGTAEPAPMAASEPAPEAADARRAADAAPQAKQRAAMPERARKVQAPVPAEPQRVDAPVASSEAASERVTTDTQSPQGLEAKQAPEARKEAPPPAPVAANPEREAGRAKSLAGSMRTMLREAAPKPSATPAPAAPQALTAAPPGAPAAALATGADNESQGAANTHCGVVRDANGRPIAGATISVSGARTFTTRTADDGSYCLDDAHAGDTLSVMRVGYDTLRLPLGERTPLAVALHPQPALGTGGGLALGGTSTSKRKQGGDGLAGSVESFLAPPADVYGGVPAPVRAQLSAAREASAMAARERSAAAHDRAALAWDQVLAATSGAASYDARFRALTERREALRAEPTPEREQRYRRDLEAYLAAVPANQPERRTVEQWRTGWDRVKAGYR